MPNPRGIQAELRATLQENERLQEENRRLKEALASQSAPAPAVKDKHTVVHPSCLPEPATVAQVSKPSDKPAKVVLFRSLFRGRDDVYAIRWRIKEVGLSAE